MAKSPVPIVVDSNEQRPWLFPEPEFSVEVRKLRDGDYSLAGLEDVFVIERKSLGDLVQTVIHDHIRFRKELNRLGRCYAACIAVESSIAEVYAGRYEGDANPESVIGRCHACYLDHGIPVLFWQDRATAERSAARLLRLAWLKYQHLRN